jgi:hypothetical protein
VKVMETAAPHPAEVAVDVVKRKRSSVKEEYLSDEAQMQNSHEIVMVLPGSLRERETHFPPIKTDTQVSAKGVVYPSAQAEFARVLPAPGG